MKEHTLRVPVSKVLRGIFGPNRDEVKREWGKLNVQGFRCSLRAVVGVDL
jgi:hypothetical protein